MVFEVVLLSPPFKGSPVADYLNKLLGPLARWVRFDEVSTSKNVFEELLSQADETFQQAFAEKVHIVKTFESETKKVPHPTKIIHHFLTKNQVESDALVPLGSQTSPFKPRSEFLHLSHHGVLTCLWPLSKISPYTRYRFIKQLFQFVKTGRQLKPQFMSDGQLDLNVGTYNLGLLPIPIWGVPFSKMRLHQMTTNLNSVGLDVLCLQEVFGNKPRALLNEDMISSYHVECGPIKPLNGLITLIKKDMVDDLIPVETNYIPFTKQRWAEPLFGFEKGFLITKFKPKNFPRPVHVVNMHLTAFENAKKIRKKQLRQIFVEYFNAQDVVFVCGDFNHDFRLDHMKETSYRAISYINKIKPKWLQEPCQRIDYVFPVTFSSKYEVKMQPEKIHFEKPVVFLKNNAQIELSDHLLVAMNIRLEHRRDQL